MNPTAHTDQVRAASAHARRIVTRAAAEHGDLVHATDQPAAGWLTGRLRRMLAQLRDGTARACPHLLNGAPQLVHAAAWAPGRLVCTDCLATLDPDPIENTTCDRCRRPADVLTGNVAALGPLLYAYALCRSCAAPTVTTRRGPRPGQPGTPGRRPSCPSCPSTSPDQPKQSRS